MHFLTMAMPIDNMDGKGGTESSSKYSIGLGNISELSFIMILKCYDNQHQKDFSVS